MYMSNITDEAQLEIQKAMTWEGMRNGFPAVTCAGGEADELSPVKHTERLMQRSRARSAW